MHSALPFSAGFLHSAAVEGLPESPVGTYELIVRSQAGAEELLLELGALQEIEQAVLAHCAAYAPEPPYKPQEYKKHLAAFGWAPEVRVPPYSAELDDWPINERYDAFKFF